VSVFVGGSVQVGLPMLADTRLDMGAASLGILMTANGIGTLIGNILSGWGTRLTRGRLGIMVLCFDGLSGVLLACLAFVHSTVAGALLLVGMGVLGGISMVAVFSWIQQRVPQAMMGRTMSILMFVFMGLGPISAAVAGALLKVISLAVLFGIAGLTLAVIALSCLGSRELRAIQALEPASDNPA
ncbi:MAG TPA: MFS transporter, partial [Rhodanobacteraceae bacterium]